MTVLYHTTNNRSKSSKWPTSPLSIIMVLWTIGLVCYPLIALADIQITAIQWAPFAAIGLGFILSSSRLPINKTFSVLFISLIYVSLIYLIFITNGLPYNTEKLTTFIYAINLFGVMLGISLQDDRFLNNLPMALLVVGGVAALLLILNPSEHSETRGTYGDANPIWMARTVSLLGVGAIWYISRKRAILAWLGLAVALGAMAYTGSRAPLLSLAICAAYGFTVMNQGRRVVFILCGAFLAVTLVILQLGFSIIPELRALDFTTGNGRNELYLYATDIIALFPQGIGVGNFNYYQYSYPHNITLEFIAEWGWALGGCFIATIVFGGIRLFMLPKKYDILKLLFILEIINSQMSGDITTPRILYALVFVGIFFGQNKGSQPNLQPKT